VLAVAGVLVFGLLPTEHVHITSTADGRHSDVIHRHYESHHPIGTSTELSDNDDDVHWLDASFTAPQQPLHDAPPHLVVHIAFEVRVPIVVLERAIRSVWTSVHDPPWLAGTGFRAPPVPSRLT
jgi:hypothetical protein